MMAPLALVGKQQQKGLKVGAYPKWTSRPACDGTDTEAWFTPEGSTTYTNENTIRKVCAGCPVREQCFDYALRHNVDGFWAGTTPRVRQVMRKRLGLVAEEISYSNSEKYGA